MIKWRVCKLWRPANHVISLLHMNVLIIGTTCIHEVRCQCWINSDIVERLQCTCWMSNLMRLLLVYTNTSRVISHVCLSSEQQIRELNLKKPGARVSAIIHCIYNLGVRYLFKYLYSSPISSTKS